MRVRAAGINFADILMRLGYYTGVPKPPFSPGLEAAGEVEAVGEGVARPRVGERVVMLRPGGCYAECVVLPAALAIPIPAAMSFEEAAALPVNYLTVYQALHHLTTLRPGERLLVHAAAGGVGLAAIQIGKLAGAELFGTASASKHDFLRQQGVQHCIDYRTQDFEEEVRRLTRGEGVDVILDAVGGASYRKSYRLLRQGGRLVCFGMSSAVVGKGRSLRALKEWWNAPSFNPLDMIGKNRIVMGLHLGPMARAHPELIFAWTQELFRLYAESKIKPHIGATFALGEAAAAHHYIHDRRNVGKVLLVPESVTRNQLA
ncbi:MAG: zinc-binding dehydrogenase [Acidobacteria bacterium]|nr:zinc-binding dehydrogenase [Acidobacteriota bacterium]